MIKHLMDYLRLVLFVCGVLIGIQVPGFVDQYGQRLEAHQLEAKQSLGEFQHDANRFFGGDINKLIRHYRQNNDPVFSAGGESIESIYQRYVQLTDALTRFVNIVIVLTSKCFSHHKQTFRLKYGKTIRMLFC